MDFKTKIRKHTIKQLLNKIIILICILILSNVLFACSRNLDLKFSISDNFFILVEWKDGNNDFILEYYYPEFDKKTTTVNTDTNSFLIERKRGLLKARIKPDTKKGEFGEWVEFEVPSLYLEVPKNIEVKKVGEGVYNIKFDKVYYKATDTEDREVHSYQLQIKIGNGEFNYYPPASHENLTNFSFNFPKDEIIFIKIRALNYFYNELIGDDKMPKELYWRYEIKNEWKEYKITL